MLDHNPEPARQEVNDIPHRGHRYLLPERPWFSNYCMITLLMAIVVLTNVGTYIVASDCGCDISEIEKLKLKNTLLKEDKQQFKVDCESRIKKLKTDLHEVEKENTELSIMNPQWLNTVMNYNTCQAQQEYFRQQYETEKKDKEMYRNRVDNMTEEMNQLRLKQLHQLHSKIQDLTTCENNKRICEEFHLKQCTETVTQLNINDKECENNLKNDLVKLAQCEMDGIYTTNELGTCQRDYKECSDELDKYKNQSCYGVRI